MLSDYQTLLRVETGGNQMISPGVKNTSHMRGREKYVLNEEGNGFLEGSLDWDVEDPYMSESPLSYAKPLQWSKPI